MTKATKALRLKIYKPKEKLLPSEWADKYRYLSPEASSEPGKWHTSRTPYLREILDCSFLEKEIKGAVVMSSSQVGKTEIELNLIGYFLDYDPCPILSIQPTLEMAEAFSKDRLAPMFRDSPCFEGKLKSPRSRDSGNTLLHKQFSGGGRLTISGANSPASLASRPIRVVLPDEVDRFPDSAGTEGDPVDLAKKRMTTFWNAFILLVSTPTIKNDSRIEKAFLQSDQRHYHLPCPHCGYEQPLKWENLFYEGKGSEDFSLEYLVYLCVNCGVGIEEKHKTSMLKTGKWVKHGKPGKIAGFHLNELYSPWKSWSDVALDYEAAKASPQQYKVWYNTSLGLPLEEDERTRYDWENLLLRAEEADYSVGQIPENCYYLTAGVDVQGNRLEVSIWGWGENEEAFLIEHQQIIGDTLKEDTWLSLEEFLERSYTHPLGAQIAISKAFIDTGFQTQDCYLEILKRRNWYAIKGKEGDRALVSAPSLQEINHRGKKIKRGIKLYLLGIDQAKSILLTRCKVDKVGAKFIHVPAGISKEWCQGFAASEILVKKHRNGRPYYYWEKLDAIKNEPLDCAVYAYCAAIFGGINRMDFKRLKKRLTLEITAEKDPLEITAEKITAEKENSNYTIQLESEITAEKITAEKITAEKITAEKPPQKKRRPNRPSRNWGKEW